MSRLRRLAPWAVPLLAATMLAAMLVPSGVWQKPEEGPTYRGLDPALTYALEKGPGAPNEGRVRVSEDALQLTALPASKPRVHLLTTPLGFRTSMDVRITERAAGATPFRVGVWSVRADNGYYIDFGPPPENEVTAELRDREGVVQRRHLGTYALATSYRLTFDVDRKEGTLSARVSSDEALPVAGGALMLAGGPTDPAYADVASALLPVRGGRDYEFGGHLRVLAGSDSYKVSVFWYDARGEFVGFSNDWRGIGGMEGWNALDFGATAPRRAASARLFLGSGNGTSLLFAGLFLRETGSARNLLANAGFEEGLEGWHVPEGRRLPEVVAPSPIDVTVGTTAREAPDLFGSYRLSLTAFASSPAGVATSVVEDFSVTLPPDLDQVVKVSDPRATFLVTALLALGTLLCVWRVAAWWWAGGRRSASSRRGLAAWAGRSMTVRYWPVLVGIGGLAVAYLVLNGLLFRLGSHPFDMTSQKVWSYVAARYGMLDEYPRSSLVTLAKAWNGSPYHEAVFPYLPVFAYYFAGVGLVYHYFLSEPSRLVMDTLSLELLIKAGNVLFGLADGFLIYRILRDQGLRRAGPLLAAALFVFNPALWVDMSLWGETETVSLFLVLLSIWAAERGNATGAWLSLGAAALTRPQMAVPALVLGVVYLRKFPPGQGLRAISWSVVLLFMLLGPFALEYSPSLPVDYVRRVYFTQLGGGAEPALQTVANSGFSVWPLATYFLDGQVGLARSSVPEAASVFGGLSYSEASNLLMAATLLSVSAVLVLRPQSTRSAPGYLPLLAVAMLGWSMVTTGMISRYFLYALAFVIISKASMRGAAYYAIVFTLTATTLVSVFGGLGVALAGVPTVAPALHDSNNVATRFFMDLYSADWFISTAVLANLSALVWLAVEAMRPRWSLWSGQRVAVREHVTA